MAKEHLPQNADKKQAACRVPNESAGKDLNITDNRPEAILQRQMQDIINKSPQQRKTRALQQMATTVVQREPFKTSEIFDYQLKHAVAGLIYHTKANDKYKGALTQKQLIDAGLLKEDKINALPKKVTWDNLSQKSDLLKDINEVNLRNKELILQAISLMNEPRSLNWKPYQSEVTADQEIDALKGSKAKVSFGNLQDISKQGTKMTAEFLGPDHQMGTPPGKEMNATRIADMISDETQVPYISGHLLNDNLGGPGTANHNLTAIPASINTTSAFSFEKAAKQLVNNNHQVIFFQVDVKYDHKYRLDNIPATDDSTKIRKALFTKSTKEVPLASNLDVEIGVYENDLSVQKNKYELPIPKLNKKSVDPKKFDQPQTKGKPLNSDFDHSKNIILTRSEIVAVKVISYALNEIQTQSLKANHAEQIKKLNEESTKKIQELEKKSGDDESMIEQLKAESDKKIQELGDQIAIKNQAILALRYQLENQLNEFEEYKKNIETEMGDQGKEFEREQDEREKEFEEAYNELNEKLIQSDVELQKTKNELQQTQTTLEEKTQSLRKMFYTQARYMPTPEKGKVRPEPESPGQKEAHSKGKLDRKVDQEKENEARAPMLEKIGTLGPTQQQDLLYALAKDTPSDKLNEKIQAILGNRDQLQPGLPDTTNSAVDQKPPEKDGGNIASDIIFKQGLLEKLQQHSKLSSIAKTRNNQSEILKELEKVIIDYSKKEGKEEFSFEYKYEPLAIALYSGFMTLDDVKRVYGYWKKSWEQSWEKIFR